MKPKKAKKPKRASSKVLKRKKKPTEKKLKKKPTEKKAKKKPTEKKVKEEEDRVKVKLELEPSDGKDGKVDFNLDVVVDPDTPGKEPLATHLEGQVHLCAFDSGLVTDMIQVDGKEMDVEMKGKTKAEGKVGLEGSIQHGEEQVRIDCHI